MGRSREITVRTLDRSLGSATYLLCDLGQISRLLRACFLISEIVTVATPSQSFMGKKREDLWKVHSEVLCKYQMLLVVSYYMEDGVGSEPLLFRDPTKMTL